MEDVALEGDEFLSSHPDKAEIPIAQVKEATAFYIVKTGTPDGRQWAVSKRFSAFVDLRKELCAASNPERAKVEALEFPPKKMFGGADRAVVKQRKDSLNVWLSSVLQLCPGDRHLAMFLAQDHSVKSQKLLEHIGLGSYTTGLDGSQDATRVALSTSDYAKPSDAPEKEPDFMTMAAEMEKEKEKEQEQEKTLSLAERLTADPNAPSVEQKAEEPAAAGSDEQEEAALDSIMQNFLGEGMDASVEVGDRPQADKITVADADYGPMDASVEAGGGAEWGVGGDDDDAEAFAGR